MEHGVYLGNFSWVMKNKVGGSDLPGRYRAADQDLEWLYSRGVRAIVSLTEEPLRAPELSKFDYLHVPVVDMTPPSVSQMNEVVRFIDGEVAKGRPVMVHCLAGIGRTGTMLAAYLVAQGYSPEKALQTIRRTRGYDLFTQEQHDAVYKYGMYMRMNGKANKKSGKEKISKRKRKR